MPRRRSSPKNLRRTVIGLLAAGVIAFAQWKGWLPKDQPKSSGKNPGQTQSGSRPSPTPPSGEWQQLNGCTLADDRSNDGDSFDVMHQGARYTIRLYFADSPEKYRSHLNAARLAEQGRYFGGLSEAETVKAGEAARDFTLPRLGKAPFTLLTRWEKVFGGPRVYAFVTVAEGDLAELLVREGLARIFTKGADRPGGGSIRDQKEKLYALERAAKKARRGAWGKR